LGLHPNCNTGIMKKVDYKTKKLSFAFKVITILTPGFFLLASIGYVPVFDPGINKAIGVIKAVHEITAIKMEL
jgi:hypothetical protein